MNNPSLPIPRPIRSYVLRQGRISHAQQRAYDSLLPRFSIPYQTTQLEPALFFERSAPVILEIGFGMGESTAQIATGYKKDKRPQMEALYPY